MNLKEVLAISGQSGLFKFVAQSKNGVIVESLTDGKRSNASGSAKVSALGEIAIYTETDDLPLAQVFENIYKHTAGKEAISPKASPEELKKFFAAVLPEYDRERVHVSDIKKVVAWYNLLIGIGMVGGTWREKGLYKTLIPSGERRMSVLPIVLGKSAAFISVYCITLSYLLCFHYKLFGYPMNGSAGTIVLFLLPYLLSCTFLGVALSSLFRHRENSLLLLLFTSIPVLMLSGASVPQECIPQWLYYGTKFIPSGSGVDGFIRIQTMGATLAEVSTQFWTLWILTAVYFLLACLGMRRVLRKTEREERLKQLTAQPES